MILEIPPEILAVIIEFCEPEHVFNFIIACKHLTSIFYNIRKRYRNKYIETVTAGYSVYKVYKGKYHGKYKTYLHDQLVEKIKHRNNVRHGITRRYCNGVIIAEYSYFRGSLHGEVIFRDKCGRIEEKLNYYNNTKHGTQYIYYDNGLVANEKNYFADTQHGKCVYYHDNGRVWISCDYVAGKIHGNYEEYNKYGEITTRRKYSCGRIV